MALWGQIFAIAFGLLASACDPGWRVGVRQPVQAQLETECVRQALLEHPKIRGVILLRHNPSYSVTGKRLPDPTIFRFETEIGLAYLTIEEGELDVSFGEIGTGPPPAIAADGPALVEDVFSWVKARCGI